MKLKHILKIVLLSASLLTINNKVALADQQYNYKYGYDWWLSNNTLHYPAYDGGTHLWARTPTVASSFPQTFSESLQSGKKISNNKGQWIDAPKGYYISEKGWTNNLEEARYNQMFSGSGIPFSNSKSYSHPKASAHGSSYSTKWDAHYRGGNDSGPWMDSVLNTYKGYYYQVYRQPKPHKSYAKPINAQYVNGNDYWYKKGSQIGIETSYHDKEGGARRRWARLYSTSGTRLLSLGVNDNGSGFVDQVDGNNFSDSRVQTVKYDNAEMIDRWYVTSKVEADYKIGSLAWNGVAFSVDDTESDKEGYNVRVDGTAPSITGTNTYGWSKSDVTISQSATDSRSGMASVKIYNSSGTELASGTNSASYKVTTTGTTTYTVKATDKVGNVSSKTVTVKIDKTAPSITGTDTYGWTKNDVTISQSATDSQSGMSNIKIYNSSGKELASGTNSVSYKVTTTGITTYTVKATDKVGNVSSKTVTVKIDKTAPSITGTDTYGWTKNDVTISQNATDSQSGMSNIKIYDNSNKELASGTNSASYKVTTEGVKTYTVKATDKVGNVSSKTVTVKIDRTAPTGTVKYNYDENTADMSITVSDIVETGSGVNKIWVEYYPKDNPKNIVSQTFDKNNNNYQGKKNLYDMFNGSVDIISMRVKAIDNVGNERILSEKEVDIFKITATIERVLLPHTPVFKGGEKGIVKIKMYGGVDKVKITFPTQLTDEDSSLNTEFSVVPKKVAEDEYEFFVPLYAESKQYKVQVIGYKNGKEKEVYPSFEVEGSILNQIRTRIRIR